MSTGAPTYLAGVGHAYSVSGRRDSALQIINQLQQLAGRRCPHEPIAEIYTGPGDNEQAFNWLKRAFEQRSGWLLHLKVNPRYDGLRADGTAHWCVA